MAIWTLTTTQFDPHPQAEDYGGTFTYAGDDGGGNYLYYVCSLFEPNPDSYGGTWVLGETAPAVSSGNDTPNCVIPRHLCYDLDVTSIDFSESQLPINSGGSFSNNDSSNTSALDVTHDLNGQSLSIINTDDFTIQGTGTLTLDYPKVTITGFVDPSGIQLTPQATNPGDAYNPTIASQTLWISSVDGKLYKGSTDVESGGGTPQFSDILGDPSDNANLDAELDAIVALAVGNQPKSNKLVSGGNVIWIDNYNFRVSAASYYIDGTLYSSAEQTITLDASDGTNPRIDVLCLNDVGSFVKITGIPAAQPSEPDYDPSTQLKLTFVLVPAGSTQPPGISNEDIYLENTEWTSSVSGSGFNADSTNNPQSGTKCIEGTTVADAAYVQLQKGSTIDVNDYGTLFLYIRSKGTWNSKRGLRIQFYSNGVAKGTFATIGSVGWWGFDSSITGTYQLVAIPVPQFIIPSGTTVDQLRISNFGGSIGFYIDNISLQSGSANFPTPGSQGITQEQADARYISLSGDQTVTGVKSFTSSPTVPTPTTGTQVSNKNYADTKQPIIAPVNAQTGTSYSLQASDNGKVVTLSNASAITLTVPSGLGAGFNCIIVQLGAGQVTVATSGTTVSNRQGHGKLAGQYATGSLIAYVADTFTFSGDTSA